MRLEYQIESLERPLRPAVVCYLLEEDQIILGLRKRVSHGLGADLISGIGGKIELDETAWETGEVKLLETDDEALVRELQEEINITPLEFQKVGRLRFIFPHKPKWNQDVIAYICTAWEGEPVVSEEIEPQRYLLTELDQVFPKMWADNEYWLPKVLAGEFVDAIFIYNEDGVTIAEMEIES